MRKFVIWRLFSGEVFPENSTIRIKVECSKKKGKLVFYTKMRYKVQVYPTSE